MSLLQATDALFEARQLFNAAALAIDGCEKSGLEDKDQRDAIATVLSAASRLLSIGIDHVEQERLGQKAVRE